MAKDGSSNTARLVLRAIWNYIRLAPASSSVEDGVPSHRMTSAAVVHEKDGGKADLSDDDSTSRRSAEEALTLTDSGTSRGSSMEGRSVFSPYGHIFKVSDHIDLIAMTLTILALSI